MNFFEKNNILDVESLDLLTQNSSDLITVLSKDGIIKYENLAVENILAYKRDELLGTDFLQLVYPDDIESVSLGLFSSKKKPCKIEYRIAHKNGEYLWMQATVQDFIDHEKINGFILNSRDITNEKEAKEKLLTERKHFFSILDAIPAPIYISDYVSYKIIYANEAKKKIYGEDIIGRTCYDVLFELDNPCDFCVNKELLKEKNKIIQREIYNEKTKQYFLTLDKLITIDTILKFHFQISLDITDQKKIDLQKEYLSAIIENTGNISVVKDLNLKVIAANMSFARAAGKSSVAELIGKTDAEIFNISPNKEPIKGYMIDERNAQKLKKGQKILREENVVYPDKSVRTVLTAKFPIFDKSDKLIATANISTDITERKKANKVIEDQNEELIKLNEDKDRFMQILSHDLKNPFNILLGFSNLAYQRVNKLGDEKLTKIVSSIQKISRTTYNLLEDLLLWSKAQSGKISFEPNYLDFLTECFEVKSLLNQSAIEKDIEFNYFETEPIRIFADKNMFQTILRNLVSNAIKFTPRMGSVNIYAEKLEGNNSIVITVADTGVGMDKETQEKIWDYTEVYSNLGTDGEKGTGFGLVICKEFMVKHGGNIWAESELGKGTSFKIEFPDS